MHTLALAADAAAPLFAPARPHPAGGAAPPPGLGFPPARRGALLLPAAGALRALRAHLGVPRLAACAPHRAPPRPAPPRCVPRRARRAPRQDLVRVAASQKLRRGV